MKEVVIDKKKDNQGYLIIVILECCGRRQSCMFEGIKRSMQQGLHFSMAYSCRCVFLHLRNLLNCFEKEMKMTIQVAKHSLYQGV